MVAPMYSEEEKTIGGIKCSAQTLREMRNQSPSSSSSYQQPFIISSNMMFKFFGSKCVGLAHLGMFAAAHTPGIQHQKREPFRNLNDIFNLADDTDFEAVSVRGSTRKPYFADNVDTKSSDPPNVVEDAFNSVGKDEEAYFDTKVTRSGVLVLRSEDIAPGRWEALSAYLKKTPSVRILRLQGVEITTKELKIIGASLKEIRHITFCDNSIGLNQGAFDVLCATLLCCSFLESTSIVRNSLDDGHVPQIVNLVSKHSSLKELSLSWNGIGDKGAIHLAKALEDMSQAVTLSLRLLDLSYNCIGVIGRQHLRAVTDKYWRNVLGEPLCICLDKQT